MDDVLRSIAPQLVQQQPPPGVVHREGCLPQPAAAQGFGQHLNVGALEEHRDPDPGHADRDHEVADLYSGELGARVEEKEYDRGHGKRDRIDHALHECLDLGAILQQRLVERRQGRVLDPTEDLVRQARRGHAGEDDEAGRWPPSAGDRDQARTEQDRPGEGREPDDEAHALDDAAGDEQAENQVGHGRDRGEQAEKPGQCHRVLGPEVSLGRDVEGIVDEDVLDAGHGEVARDQKNMRAAQEPQIKSPLLCGGGERRGAGGLETIRVSANRVERHGERCQRAEGRERHHVDRADQARRRTDHYATDHVGDHIAGGNQREQPLALAHVEDGRGHAPEGEAGDCVLDEEPGHQQRHRPAASYGVGQQEQRPGSRGGEGQVDEQDPRGRQPAAQPQENGADRNRRAGPDEIGIGERVGAVALQEQRLRRQEENAGQADYEREQERQRDATALLFAQVQATADEAHHRGGSLGRRAGRLPAVIGPSLAQLQLLRDQQLTAAMQRAQHVKLRQAEPPMRADVSEAIATGGVLAAATAQLEALLARQLL